MTLFPLFGSDAKIIEKSILCAALQVGELYFLDGNKLRSQNKVEKSGLLNKIAKLRSSWLNKSETTIVEHALTHGQKGDKLVTNCSLLAFICVCGLRSAISGHFRISFRFIFCVYVCVDVQFEWIERKKQTSIGATTYVSMCLSVYVCGYVDCLLLGGEGTFRCWAGMCVCFRDWVGFFFESNILFFKNKGD